MKLSIQIVNFRSRRCLERCLLSIDENLPAGIETEVLIVNNDENPLEEIADELSSKLGLKIHEIGENIGFGKAHNAGFEHSRGEYILFLNPDTKLLPGALQALTETLDGDQSIGVAGPLLIDAEDKIQADCFGTRRTPLSMVRKKLFERGLPSIAPVVEIFETDWVSGGSMMVRRNVFEGISGFDENFFMYFEDVDLCFRAKELGHRVVVNPKARVFHEGGKSFASVREKKTRYYASQNHYTRKHFGRAASVFVKLLQLPYYVKNVRLAR